MLFTDAKSREWLLDMMQTEVVSIEFIKSDGSIRNMSCTLDNSLIPVDMLPKGTSERARSDEVCPVFDIENVGWRSFRWDSVTKVIVS